MVPGVCRVEVMRLGFWAWGFRDLGVLGLGV